MNKFKLQSKFKPTGDQPQAIAKLNSGLKNYKDQTLLGVTGSGKTLLWQILLLSIRNQH